MRCNWSMKFYRTYAWIEPTLIIAPPFGICGTACRTRSNTEEQSIIRMCWVSLRQLTSNDVCLECVFHSFMIQLGYIRLKIDGDELIGPDNHVYSPLACLDMRHCWLGYRCVWISIPQYRWLFYIELPELEARFMRCAASCYLLRWCRPAEDEREEIAAAFNEKGIDLRNHPALYYRETSTTTKSQRVHSITAGGHSGRLDRWTYHKNTFPTSILYCLLCFLGIFIFVEIGNDDGCTFASIGQGHRATDAGIATWSNQSETSPITDDPYPWLRRSYLEVYQNPCSYRDRSQEPGPFCAHSQASPVLAVWILAEDQPEESEFVEGWLRKSRAVPSLDHREDRTWTFRSSELQRIQESEMQYTSM